MGLPAASRLERLTLLELEREVDAAVVLADVEERGDVRVRQRREAARLLDQRGAVRGEVRRQQTDRDRPSKLRVARAIQIAWAGGSSCSSRL